MFKVKTSQMSMMSLVICLLFIPQYSHGINYVSNTRAPGNCPYQYFESPLPERANFNQLKQMVAVYGERAISSQLLLLLNNNVTLRSGGFYFTSSTGAPSLDQVDECSLMYDFLKTDITLEILEKRTKEALRLAEQRKEQDRANHDRLIRESRLANKAFTARLAEEARLAKEVKLAEEAKLAEETRLTNEVMLAQEKRIAEIIRLSEAKRAERAKLAEDERLADEKKFEALKHSADQGDANAQYLLALEFETGGVVLTNEEESLRWYRQAAEQGNREAQYSLGYKDYNDRAYTKAFKWLKLSAEQGHVEAQHLIGVIYVEGKGIDEDVEEGLLWLGKAAEQGSQKSIRIISEHNTLRTQKRAAIVKGVTWLIIFVTIAFMIIKFRKNMNIIVKDIFTRISSSIERIIGKISDIRWPLMSDIGLGAGVGCMYAVGCFIVGGVVTFIPVIGWFLGPIIILSGFISPFVGVGSSFTQGDSEKYRHVTNPCPYCQHRVTVNVNDLGANCPACKKRFVLRGDKYFAV